MTNLGDTSMTRIRRIGVTDRAIAGVLADIAHELSSTSDWKARLQNALSLLCDIIPTKVAGLGVQIPDWQVYFCPDVDNIEDLSELLLEHYALLTGEVTADNHMSMHEAITQGIGELGSFLSMPVIGAGQVLGVLHVSIEQDNAYSREDVSVLSVVALQIGSFVRNVMAHEEEVKARRQIEELSAEAQRQAREADSRRNELESFVSSMADGVAFFDATGNMLMMNDAARVILGCPNGLSCWSWIEGFQRYTLDGQSMPFEESATMRAVHGEMVRDARYRIESPDGKTMIISVSASPVRDASGNVLGAVTIFRDVSEEVDFHQRRQEIFEREHHIAQMLQQALIPPQVDYEMDGVRIAVKYEPAMKEAEVGGDFYDIFKLKDGKVGILIGDVAGKGLPAAIRVAAARYAVRSYAYLDSSPGLVMTRVNDALCRDEAGDESMLTAIFLVMDTTQGTLAYASGGHEPPMLRSADGSVHELTQGGRVLGVFANYCYEEETRVMEPGDTLVIVTDGITEARSGTDLFGSEGVEKFLKDNRNLTPSQTASGLLQAATEKANGVLQDDAAIVVLQLI